MKLDWFQCDFLFNIIILLSTVTRSRFQVKPATLLIPIDPFFFLVEFYGNRYQSGSVSIINVGSVLSLPA
jgi:hypothetical protein